MTHFKFQKTSCSQCGEEFGPGDHGFSHCSDHVFMGSDSIARLLSGKLVPKEYQAVMKYIRALEGTLKSRDAVEKAKKHPFIYSDGNRFSQKL